MLKTYDPPIDRAGGLTITGVGRHGKFLDLDCRRPAPGHPPGPGRLAALEGLLPAAPPKPGKGPLAMRVHLDDGSGFDLTEAGTQKRLAVYVVRDPQDVPGSLRSARTRSTDDFDTAELAACWPAGAPRSRACSATRA